MLYTTGNIVPIGQIMNNVTKVIETTTTIVRETDLNDYYKKEQIDETLDEYATKLYVQEEIVKIGSGGEVDLSELATKTDLESYPTKTELGTTLQGYTTNSGLTTTLEGYTTNSGLTTTLGSYPTKTELGTTLQGYTTNSGLTTTLESYTTNSGLTTTLGSYPTKTELGTTLQGYTTNSGLTTTLESYPTKGLIFDDGNVEKSIVIGKDSNVDERVDNSVVIGVNATSSTNGSVAIGCSSNNLFYQVVPEEPEVVVQQPEPVLHGDNSIAIGNSAQTKGNQAIAIGYSAGARADSSITIGHNATTTTEGAIVIGNTTANKSFQVGPNTMSLDSTGMTFNEQPKINADLTPTEDNDIATKKYVDDNAGGGDTSDFLTKDKVFQNGDVNSNIMVGKGAGSGTGTSFKTIENSVVIGSSAYAGSDRTVVIGHLAKAPYTTVATSAITGVAIGYNACASGDNVVALGYNAMGNNTNSVAIGNGAGAAGETTIAIGARAYSAGPKSIGIGFYTNAYGDYSMAIGRGTTSSYKLVAGGKYSIAIGTAAETTKKSFEITGEKSIGIGCNIMSSVDNTITIGSDITNSTADSVVIGNTDVATITLGKIAITTDGSKIVFTVGSKKFTMTLAT